MIKPAERGVRLVCLTAALLSWGCGGSGSSNGGSGGQKSGSGGASGTGGQASTGGQTGSGGATPGSGGTTSSGGTVGTGGKVATGGVTSSSGGVVGSGGMSSTGGMGTGGSPGSGGRDAGTGGTAGMAASGGSAQGGSAAAGRSGTGGSGAAGATGSVGGAGGAVDTTAMAAAMGFGVNIGNTFDNTTTWETGWGQPLVTQAFIQGLASRGVKSVRVPVAWNTYATNGVIPSDKMNRVKEVVGWILDAGMYAMVNIHWDGGWIDAEGTSAQYTLTSDTKTKFASYWTQIATAFASVGNNLIFEGLNEEGKFYVNGDSSGTPDYAALNTLNQLFVTTVRAQGGYNPGRALLIAGFTTDITLTCVDGFTIPTDPAGAKKLFLSIHYYTPYTFCGLDTVESWGSPQTTWGTSADQTALQNDFTKLASCSTQKKIPIIIGEFGVTKGMNYPRQSSARIMWMESVTKAAYAHGMVPMLWDTGTDISRTDGSFDTELQTVMTETKP